MHEHEESLVRYAAESPLHYLWGLVADLVVTVATTLLSPIAALSVLVSGSTRALDWIAWFWSALIVKVCGISIEVEGLEYLEPGRSYIVLSNHQSLLDIPVTLAAVPRTIRFVAKKELLKTPAFGAALRRSDHIVIDRKDPRSAMTTLNSAMALCSEGICVLFYAEGSRSDDGKVKAFKKGGVMMAIQSGLPIVPLSVSGTRKFLPKGCAVVRPGGKVRLTFAQPIETSGLTLESREEVNARVRQQVIENYREEF